MTTPQPKIYIACLAAYNEGLLHGAWVEADQGLDHIWDGINAVLASSPIPGAEEWAVHDYQDMGDTIAENPDLEQVAEKGAWIVENGTVGLALLDHFSGDLADAKRAFEEFQGEYDRFGDFVAELVEETWNLPDKASLYIDYEKLGRDLLISDYFTIELPNRKILIFRQH